MKLPKFLLYPILLTICAPLLQAAETQPDPAELEASLKKTADWYLDHPIQWLGMTVWHVAPLYDGLLALSETTGDAKYLSAVIDFGERVAWAPGGRTYHADDQAVGHAWVDIYAMDSERTERLQPIRDRMSHVVENPVRKTERWRRFRNSNRLHWWWCDALYMAPPTLTRLAKVTGDQKYLRFMDYEFRRTYDKLYDAEESLFYRDEAFFDARTPRGKKVFWSRGNGWVYGGLALVMDDLPETDLSFAFYKKLYLEMTEAIVELQAEEGLWWPSLLDSSHVNSKETSGSAFFVYGLAWGINRGYLDKETYMPVVVKGWEALLDCVHPDGKLGYVQPVGAAPEDNILPESTQAYGVGAFLLAGSEILKIIGGQTDDTPEAIYTRAEADYEAGASERQPVTYYVPERMDDVAWENDKVAFRVYGPALRDSTEDSGIDVWQKRVNYPVVKKWYEKEFAGKGSYHEDTGEGYDAYKVGAARGCGGTGLWYKGKLYTSNTYQYSGLQMWPDGTTGFMVNYSYEIEGRHIRERKNIILREGSYLCEGKSMFFGPDEILLEVKAVIGLTAQSSEAKVVSEDGILTMWDNVNGYWLATGVKIDGSVAGIETVTTESAPDDTLLLIDLDPYYRAVYAFGYTWERHTDMDSHDSWREYIADFPVTIGPIQMGGRTDPDLFHYYQRLRQ